MNLCHHPTAQKSQKNGTLSALKYHLRSTKETNSWHSNKTKQKKKQQTNKKPQPNTINNFHSHSTWWQENRRENLSELRPTMLEDVFSFNTQASLNSPPLNAHYGKPGKWKKKETSYYKHV